METQSPSRDGFACTGFCGERTQEPAAKQVQGWFEDRGWEVRLAPMAEHYVHIDLMVCMLGHKLAAVCLDTTEDWIIDWLKAKNIEIIPVNYRDTMELGCNVVALGNDKVLSTAASKCPSINGVFCRGLGLATSGGCGVGAIFDFK